MEIPRKELEDKAAVSNLPMPSDIRIKRKGESGSPCLIPQEGVKVEEGVPLTRIGLKHKKLKP